jgi:hypothetical protein
MRILNLTATASTVLDANGNGTAQGGPTSPGTVWLPAIASVNCNEAEVINEAACKTYAGAFVSSGTFVDGTLSGSSGDSTQNIAGRTIYPGQYVFAVWTGGDPGALAVLNVTGTRQVP